MNVNPRIIAASAAGLMIVGGAFWLRQVSGPPPAALTTAEAPATPTRSFIPVSDADQDGLPDWQNTLHLPTISIDKSAAAATTTKTGALAAEIATRTYLGGGTAGTVLSGLSTNLTKEAVDKDYAVSDIKVSQDTSLAAKKAYGNQVAGIALEHAVPPGTESELVILNRALLRDDPRVLEGLDPIIASYEAMLAAMLATPAPSSLTREHLALINVYQALRNDIKAFRQLYDDALPAMVRFRRYQADTEALYAAILMLYDRLHREGIRWSDADLASRLIKVNQ